MNTVARVVAIAAFLSVGAAHTAHANLVVNGSFETNGGVGQLAGGITSLAGWTVGPTVVTSNTPANTPAFDFVMNGDADATGFPSVYSPPNIFLWGPRTPRSAGGPVANGFTGSPDGGSFFGSDGGFATAPISQTISGLTVGQQYTLTFQYAAAQASEYFGATQQDWQVTFGADTFTTPVVSNPSQGFTGWTTYTNTFTATSTDEILNFLAVAGTPKGIVPFTLLDGVSLTAAVSSVPESSSLSLLAIGMVGLISRRRSSRRR